MPSPKPPSRDRTNAGANAAPVSFMTDQKARFIRIYPDALPPMPGDPSALGSLPTSAFQYCEPVRTASALGWYMFPPKNFQLMFDGAETFFANGETWEPLISENFEPEFMELWNDQAPEAMQDRPPPFLSSVFVPGVVQLWTGFLISTASGWGTHVRPIANADFAGAYQCYDGVVETDRFGPWPVFINLRITSTNRPIYFFRDRPLFQLQLIPDEAKTMRAQKADWSDFRDGISPDDWQGLKNTLRSSDPREEPDRKAGKYAVASRKRDKS